MSDRDALILAHLKLVTTIAEDFAGAARARNLPWDDVLAAGCLGLIRAAERYKADKGRFSLFCRKHIRGAIRKTLKLNRPMYTGIDLSFVADHRKSPLPDLEPAFPITSYTPESDCPHHGPIRDGMFVCGVCWRAAAFIEARPDMQLTWRDFHPNRRRRVAAELPQPKQETRRDRRLRIFGAGARPVAV